MIGCKDESPNRAFVTDACAAALRGFYSPAQRGPRVDDRMSELADFDGLAESRRCGQTAVVSAGGRYGPTRT
jgi:hypothetical protein